jgi:hypothetical protein
MVRAFADQAVWRNPEFLIQQLDVTSLHVHQSAVLSLANTWPGEMHVTEAGSAVPSGARLASCYCDLLAGHPLKRQGDVFLAGDVAVICQEHNEVDVLVTADRAVPIVDRLVKIAGSH